MEIMYIYVYKSFDVTVQLNTFFHMVGLINK